MTKLQIIGCIVSLLSVAPVQGLISADIQTTKKLKVTFSNRDTNRISVDNGRISQVFGVEDMMSIQFDEENGQCFLKSKMAPEYPVTLTLITEEGETQDIEVTFSDRPSETVILHSLKVPFKDAAEKDLEEDGSLHWKGVDVIKQFVRQKNPKGFRQSQDMTTATLRLPNGCTLMYEQTWSGGGMEVRIGKITNVTSEVRCLKESSCAGEADLAVYLSSRELHPKESCRIIVVRPGGTL